MRVIAIIGVCLTLAGCFQMQFMNAWACEGARPDPRCSHPAPIIKRTEK